MYPIVQVKDLVQNPIRRTYTMYLLLAMVAPGVKNGPTFVYVTDFTTNESLGHNLLAHHASLERNETLSVFVFKETEIELNGIYKAAFGTNAFPAPVKAIHVLYENLFVVKADVSVKSFQDEIEGKFYRLQIITKQSLEWNEPALKQLGQKIIRKQKFEWKKMLPKVIPEHILQQDDLPENIVPRRLAVESISVHEVFSDGLVPDNKYSDSESDDSISFADSLETILVQDLKSLPLDVDNKIYNIRAQACDTIPNDLSHICVKGYTLGKKEVVFTDPTFRGVELFVVDADRRDEDSMIKLHLDKNQVAALTTNRVETIYTNPLLIGLVFEELLSRVMTFRVYKKRLSLTGSDSVVVWTAKSWS